jgi:hypothetical protein
MTFVVELDCDNAAFEGEACGTEIARLLRKVADKAERNDAIGGTLLDANGNHCGRWRFEL